MSCVMSLWCGPRPAHYWAVWSRVASALSGVASPQPPCHYYTSLPHHQLTLLNWLVWTRRQHAPPAE